MLMVGRSIGVYFAKGETAQLVVLAGQGQQRLFFNCLKVRPARVVPALKEQLVMLVKQFPDGLVEFSKGMKDAVSQGSVNAAVENIYCRFSCGPMTRGVRSTSPCLLVYPLLPAESRFCSGRRSPPSSR